MNQLRCPNCGLRNLNEFSYGGEVRPRPQVEGISMAQWAEYLYTRANPMGNLREWWYHRAGCGTWFIAQRHTKTHAVLRTEYAPATEQGGLKGSTDRS